MTDEKDARLTRQLIREELDASNSYEEKAQATSDPEAAKVYRDISREEKVHAGELQALLDREDPESTDAMKEGIEETGLEGSFKDIFDRKREDYIHKSVYGVHIEKRNKKKEIEEQRRTEEQAAKYSKEGQDQAKMPKKGPFVRDTPDYDPFEMTIGDLFMQNYRENPPDKEPGTPNDVLEVAAKQVNNPKVLIDAGKKNVGSMPKVGEAAKEFKRIADQDQAEQPRPKNPTGKMEPPIDELDKAPKNALNDTLLSPQEAFIQIMERQKTGTENEGEGLSMRRKELSNPYNHRPDMGTEAPTVRERTLDYDRELDPDEISKEEVEAYLRNSGNTPVTDPIAPNSARRPWLTWKYFGNHLLQATPIIMKPARDDYGRRKKRVRRVPKMEEVDDPVKGKIWVPTGEFEDRVEDDTEYIMNYRISRTGKDTQFDQKFYQFRTRWDPSAYNPAKKDFSGAFVPVSITTPDGETLYEINGVGYVNKEDPWELFEEDLAKRALMNGIEEYIRNPEFREKLAQTQLPRNYVQATQYANEVAKMVKDEDGGQMLAKLKAALPPGVTLNKVIAQISKHYEGINQEVEAQKQAMASDKEMLDTAVRMAAEEDLKDHIDRWIEAKGIKGADGSDVSADTIGNYFDKNTGTFHLQKNNQEYLLPKQNFDAWADHMQETYERRLRKDRLAVIEKEEATQAALDERLNAEDAAIENYMYHAFRKKYEKETGMTPSRLNDVEDQLREQANLATHEILYGDGKLFQKILKKAGVIDPDVKPRDFMLNKAGFNWDIVQHNKQEKMRKADRAIAEELASLADPKYHERIKTELNEIRAKQKFGILGLLATRKAHREAANTRTVDLQNSIASAIQDFTTRMKDTPLYGSGELMFDASQILGDKWNSGAGAKVKQHLKERYAEDIRNGKGPKTDDEEGWNQFYTEKLNEHIPNTLMGAIENVRSKLTSGDEKDRQEFDAYLRKALSKKLGSNTVNKFMERIADPELDVGSVLNDIQTNANDGHAFLRTLINANNLVLTGDANKRNGAPIDGTSGLDYKKGQKELTGMFVAALQGADSGAEFDALREVARQYTLNILDNKPLSMDPNRASSKYEKLAKEEVRRVFRAVQDKEVKEYFMRAALEHNGVPRKPGEPHKGTKNYDVRMARYQAKMAEYDKAVEANYDAIMKEFNESMADPKKVAEAKNLLFGVVKFKTLSAVSKDRRARRVLSNALGHDDKVMSKTGFRPFMDQALAVGEKDFIEQQDKNRRLTPEEEYQNRLAMYKKDGMSDAQALIDSFKDMGYSDRQARLEAQRYLELRDMDYDESGELSPAYRDLTSNTNWGVGDINIEGSLGPQDLDEAAYRKVITSAMASNFKKLVEDMRQKNPNAKIVTDYDKAKDKAGKLKVMGEFYSDLGLMAPMESKPGVYKVVMDAFFEGKNKYANELLNNFIGKNFSLRDAESLGLPIRDVQTNAMKGYDAGIDRILRERMIDTLTERFKGEDIYAGRPRLAKIDAANLVNEAFPHMIGRDDLNENGNEEFFAKLQQYGVPPEQLKAIRVQAMKESNSPLYSDFISPYFTGSGREEGEDRDSDELDLFEGLSRGFQTQQNPALTQAWNDYYSKAGTLTPSQAAEVRRRLGISLGDLIANKRAHTQELRDFLAAQGAPLENIGAVNAEKRGLLDKFEGDSALKEHYNNHIRRTNQLMEALGYAPVNVPEEHNAYPEFEEFPEVDTHYMNDARSIPGSKEMILPMRSERARGRYNMLVYDAVQTYAKKHDGNLEYLLKGWEEIDPVEFQKELSDSAMRRMMYMSKTGELPPDTIQDDSDRIARAVYSSLVYNPDTTLNFADEGVRRLMWNIRHKANNPEQSKASSVQQDTEEDAEDEETKTHREAMEKWTVKRNPKKVAEKEFAEALGHENPHKTQDGQIDHTVETPVVHENVPNYLGQTSDTVAQAEDKPMVKDQEFTATKGDTITVSGQKKADDFTNSSVLTPKGRTPRKDVTDQKIKVTNSTGSTEDTKKSVSAFDTPFADIMTSKRSQAIRKNETGTVISSEPVSAPMTEQADAPQEQNSIEAGGFAELMKSKMASTHMMEEPSEEREDWIPMRNGYRRVTIGSGKDCVHSMMRNPPRSANAPGTRTRKV